MGAKALLPNILEIGFIHGHNVIEIDKIFEGKLSGLMRQGNSVCRSHFPHTFIGQTSDVIGSSARRITLNQVIKPFLFDKIFKNTFCNRGTANISQANKEYVNQSAVVSKQF